jgi:hypothetical protein
MCASPHQSRALPGSSAGLATSRGNLPLARVRALIGGKLDPIKMAETLGFCPVISSAARGVNVLVEAPQSKSG